MNASSWRIPLLLLCLGVGILFLGGSPTDAKTMTSPLEPIPTQLEELIERALLGNPEILLKDAELRESIAALNQSRLAVTQQVVRLHFLRREQREVVRAQKDKLNERRAEQKGGLVTMTSVRDATIELAQAEGALARTEADLRYSIGVSGTEGRGTQARAIDILMQSTSLQTPPDEEDAPIPRKPVPSALQAKLKSPFAEVAFDDLPITEAIDFITQLSGVNFLISPDLRSDLEGNTISLSLQGEVSFENTLRAVADMSELQFVYREYGFLVMWRDHDFDDGSLVIH